MIETIESPITAHRMLSYLPRALQKPLPGPTAQFEMAPEHRRHSPPALPQNPRKAAVLALFFEAQQEISLLFTQRALTLKHHKGQICFPGGGYETSDQTFTHTALRETAEELGISARHIKILGQLTPLYIPGSDNLVYPIVGWLTTLPQITPNVDEVAQVIFTPLRELLDPRNISTYIYQTNSATETAPCYRINGTCIWGATAMITSELLTIIENILAQ